MSKTFNQVKLNVNFTAISPSSNMSNIASNDNISDTLAKIHHWYVKTNGFQATSPPLVSTSNNGIVTALSSTTGGFLKNTGTVGGAWTTIGISDLPRDDNFEKVLTNYGDLCMRAVFEPYTDGDGTEVGKHDEVSGKAQLGSSDYRWSRIYGVNLYATKLNDVTIPNNPVFTDTITTVSTTGSGNAITAITASNGALTATKGSTFSLSTHTHDSLVSKTLTAATLDDTSGNLFFKGDSLLGNTNDWVGIQADSGNDKFQLIANDNTLMFRQNDANASESESWRDWVGLLTPVDVTGTNGITITQTSSDIGTGNTALQYTRGINIQHTNSVTAETTFNKSRFKYDAQGHVTSSDYWVHTAFGTGNTAGWIKIATMVHTKTYDNTPIMLTIAQRSIPIYRLHIRFTNSDNTDPDIAAFFLSADAFDPSKKPSAYIIKTTTSTWDLYIKKLDVYDHLSITEFDVGGYFADHMTWVWKNEQTDESAITGGTAATLTEHSQTNHTHSNYLGAATVSGNSYYGIADPDGTDANWIRTTSQGILPYESGSLGSGHQSLGASTWYFANSYIDRMNSSRINLAGTLPRLNFRQTTSGAENSNDNSGITCYPSNNSGMNMTIQSGGNMIIGSGEFPMNIYNRSTNDPNFSIQYGTTSSYYKPTDTSETTWIGSDGNIYLFANADSIGTTENTDYYYWQFNMNGKTWLPKGKDLNWTNSDGYSASMVPGSNTANITLTLPSSSGTLINDTNIRGSKTCDPTNNSYNEESISKVQLPKGCVYSSNTTLGWYLIATITREGSFNTDYNIGGTLLCQSGNSMIASPGLLYINTRVGGTSGIVSGQYLRWIKPMFTMSETTSRVETGIKYCAITWNNKKCTDPTVGDLSSSTYNSTGDITTQIWVKLPSRYLSHSCTLIDQIMPPPSGYDTDYVRWHFPSNVVRNNSSWSNFYTSSDFGDPENPASASSSTIVGKAYAAASNNANNIYLARYVDERVAGYPETPWSITQQIDLTTLSWTQSAQGLYYSSEVTISTSVSSVTYNCAKVYSAIITGFSSLRATDNVNVISNSNATKIRFTASTNSFYSNGTNHANVTVAVYGIFYK